VKTTRDEQSWRVLAAAAVLLAALLGGACVGDGKEPAAREESGVAEAAFAEAVAPGIEAAVGEAGEGAVAEAVAAAYAERGHRPLWLSPDGPTARGKELAVALLEARRHGLDPTDYEGERLALAVAGLTRREARADEAAYAARVAELEPELTTSLLTLARHLARGRLAPDEAGIHWESRPREIDLAKVLQVAVDEGPARALAAARPPHEQYAKLEEALGSYRRIVAGGGWPAVPGGDTLEPGDEDPQRVVALRRRLAAEGYATGGAAEAAAESSEGDAEGQPADALSPVYDERLAEAVREYQRRRGLEPDGLVGGKTLDELNVPAAERVRQIEANLERWRWMPADLGDRYVLVNVPRFELHAVEGGEEVMRMRVVVGEELNATPMFSDRMQYVVFNPYWNIPHTIAGEEVIPALARDRSYLAANDMEVVRGWENGQVLGSWVSPSLAAQAAEESSGIRIRQRPGPDNPLGQIKFLFPNEHAIYLHDTSAGHLFDETVRLFSHGCIRIEKPVELAAWALGRPASEIRAKMQSGASDEWEALPREIPVHILYYTVAVDDDGRVLFFDDFYGIDEQVLAALDQDTARGVAGHST
jgi:L,D-transpeptidase YcbB